MRIGIHELSEGHSKLHTKKINEWAFFGLCLYFNEMHDCVKNASRTAANQIPSWLLDPIIGINFGPRLTRP